MRPIFVILLVVPVTLVLLVAIGVAVAVANYDATYQGRVYPGVSALGEDLSGQSREEARRLLGEHVARILAQPLALAAGGQEWRQSAAELGLELEVDSLVDQALAVGRQGWVLPRARGLWELRQSGRTLGAIQPRVNQETALQVLRRIAAQIDRPTIDAALSIGRAFDVQVTPAQSGRKLDQGESLRRIRNALVGGEDRVGLVAAETSPAVLDEQVAAAAEKARTILSGPLTLTYGQQVWTVGRDELRTMLRFERRASGAFEVVLDQAPLEALARRIAGEVEQTPVDARFAWAQGRLEVLRPSRPGVSLEPEQAVQAMLAALASPNHTLKLPVSVAKAAVPMEERYGLGIKELVEESSTTFAGSVPAKRHNIRLAAERINGTVVPPGATFSFNEAVGPTTLEAGFRWGYAIQGSNGVPKTVPSVAGGICQVATTLLHSVFWAGYTIEERYPHLYWIPNYASKGTIGIDTTVDEEAGLDFRFTNPTSSHLLIQAWTDESDKLHFALYGTKPDWKVEVEGPTKSHPRPADPKPIVEDDPTLPYGQRVVVEAARDGFDVRLVRKVTSQGETRTLNLVSRYQPSHNVTLVGTAGRPTPTPSPVATPAVPQPTTGPGDQPPQPTPTPAQR
ncbi:MAG: VanW family protein [Chloroflexi bacterium]|nr:VanW family protein [Chloroflexota bacterium]